VLVTVRNCVVSSSMNTQVKRQDKDPLPQRLAGQHEVHEVRRRFSGPSRCAARTKAPVLAGTLVEGQEPVFQAVSVEDLEAHRRQLQALGQELLESYARDVWPCGERARCEAMACLHLRQCA